MVRGRGSRSSQTPSGFSSGYVVRERKEGRDTTNQLIREVSFDQHEGNYVVDLIYILRDYLNDPLQSDQALIKIVFTPVNEKQLETYINSYDVYLVGFRIGDALFEFGKYPTHVPPVPNEMPMTEKQRKKNIKLEQYGSAEKRVAISVTQRQLKGSHLLGFGEGYGQGGITDPSDVLFGRENLKKSIKKLCDDYHRLEDDKTNKGVCFSWRDHLTVIIVMVCEAARFRPMCWFFSELITDGKEEKLLKGLREIINLWGKMSKIHHEQESKLCDGVIPVGYRDFNKANVMTFSRDVARVNELSENEAWVVKVLAVVCRRK